jgi:hypothetical protein
MARKKFQIFVSSTFVDLKDERQAVSKAILNLGHIPAGMELFPASDIDQLSFIKRVIDDCDYYVLIVGGKYGSLSDSGLSYTELEYQYAVETKKPILAFLHENVSDLKHSKVEADTDRLEKLEKFREKVKAGRLVEFWSSIENLESKALVSLTNAFNDQPQIGWRRDTSDLTLEAQQKFDKMREERDRMLERFRHTLKKSGELSEKLEGYESLKDTVVEIRFSTSEGSQSVEIGAEQIIREFASDLIHGLSIENIKHGLMDYVSHKIDGSVSEISTTSANNVALFLEVFEICTRESGILSLIPEKKWLLKAAFKPLNKVMAARALEDDIPF